MQIYLDEKIGDPKLFTGRKNEMAAKKDKKPF